MTSSLRTTDHVICSFCNKEIPLNGEYSWKDDAEVIETIRRMHEKECDQRELIINEIPSGELKKGRDGKISIARSDLNPRESFESAKVSIETLASIATDLDEEEIAKSCVPIQDAIIALEKAFKKKYRW